MKPEVLAQKIKDFLSQGATLESIYKSAIEQGVSEDIWNQALELSSSPQTPVVSKTINPVASEITNEEALILEEANPKKKEQKPIFIVGIIVLILSFVVFGYLYLSKGKEAEALSIPNKEEIEQPVSEEKTEELSIPKEEEIEKTEEETKSDVDTKTEATDGFYKKFLLTEDEIPEGYSLSELTEHEAKQMKPNPGFVDKNKTKHMVKGTKGHSDYEFSTFGAIDLSKVEKIYASFYIKKLKDNLSQNFNIFIIKFSSKELLESEMENIVETSEDGSLGFYFYKSADILIGVSGGYKSVIIPTLLEKDKNLKPIDFTTLMTEDQLDRYNKANADNHRLSDTSTIKMSLDVNTERKKMFEIPPEELEKVLTKYGAMIPKPMNNICYLFLSTDSYDVFKDEWAILTWGELFNSETKTPGLIIETSSVLDSSKRIKSKHLSKKMLSEINFTREDFLCGNNFEKAMSLIDKLDFARKKRYLQINEKGEIEALPILNTEKTEKSKPTKKIRRVKRKPAVTNSNENDGGLDCEAETNPIGKDMCYRAKSAARNDPSYCEKIKDVSRKQACIDFIH